MIREKVKCFVDCFLFHLRNWPRLSNMMGEQGRYCVESPMNCIHQFFLTTILHGKNIFFFWREPDGMYRSHLRGFSESTKSFNIFLYLPSISFFTGNVNVYSMDCFCKIEHRPISSSCINVTLLCECD